jgi:hypothetical protein
VQTTYLDSHWSEDALNFRETGSSDHAALTNEYSKPAFPYGDRAAQARAAREQVTAANEAWVSRDDPKYEAFVSAVEDLRRALEAAYPPGFWQVHEALKKGRAKRRSIETAIEFLEADPWFNGSGYVKEDLIRFVKRLPLDPEQSARLRQVVLNVVDGRDRREFRHYCRLALWIFDSEFLQELETRSASPDEGIRRRATWMLEMLTNRRRRRKRSRNRRESG